MEVILRESVPNLGEPGDLVNVKGGYARNYLIPQGMAYSASSSNAAQISHKKRLLEDQQKRQIKTEEEMAKRLSEISVSIPVKVGEEDRIFGSVTSQHIADALSKKGYNIDRRKINLDEPIRALGVYTVPVRFSGNITGNVKVWVVKEES